MTGIEWRSIDDFPGYEVANQGDVRSVDRTVTTKHGGVQHWKGKVLRTHVHNTRHLIVRLYAEGNVQHSKPVHQLVAAAFIGPRPEGHEVCHNNGIHTDNRAENLRYDTRSANQLDSVKHGTHGQASKTHCPKGHEYTEANTYRPPKYPNNRQCRACSLADQRANQRARRARRKAKTACSTN